MNKKVLIMGIFVLILSMSVSFAFLETSSASYTIHSFKALKYLPDYDVYLNGYTTVYSKNYYVMKVKGRYYEHNNPTYVGTSYYFISFQKVSANKLKITRKYIADRFGNFDFVPKSYTTKTSYLKYRYTAAIYYKYNHKKYRNSIINFLAPVPLY